MDCRLKIKFVELEFSNLIFKIQVQINRELGFVWINMKVAGSGQFGCHLLYIFKLNSHHVMQSCDKITFSRGKVHIAVHFKTGKGKAMFSMSFSALKNAQFLPKTAKSMMSNYQKVWALVVFWNPAEKYSNSYLPCHRIHTCYSFLAKLVTTVALCFTGKTCCIFH